MVHHHIRQGDFHFIYAVNAKQAANRALNGDGRMHVNKALGVGCNMRRARPGLINELPV